MRPELLVQAVFALATAAFYGWIGLLIHRRSPSEEAKAANQLFALWWVSLSALYLLTGALNAAAAIGRIDLALAIAWIDFVLILLCVALWALLGFLLYLYTGSRKWFLPLGFAYAVLAFLLLWFIAWLEPTGLKNSGLGVQFDYAREAPDWMSTLLGLTISVPIVLAALGYGSLYFRIHERLPRYRIAMVAGAFLVWFGWSILSTLLDLNDRFRDSWGLYGWNQAIAILVPVVILMAYRPPAWVRARLGIATSEG